MLNFLKERPGYAIAGVLLFIGFGQRYLDGSFAQSQAQDREIRAIRQEQVSAATLKKVALDSAAQDLELAKQEAEIADARYLRNCGVLVKPDFKSLYPVQPGMAVKDVTTGLPVVDRSEICDDRGVTGVVKGGKINPESIAKTGNMKLVNTRIESALTGWKKEALRTNYTQVGEVK